MGLTLDPEEIATITEVAANSPAAESGFEPGDRIHAIDGQPILSIADVQWALHRTEDEDSLKLTVQRSPEAEADPRPVTLTLDEGWRRHGEFVERVSSWDLFKVKLFGVAKMPALSGDERQKRGLPADSTALLVEKLTPSWGGMNKDARAAGLHEGDVVVEVDGRTDIHTHGELLAYLAQEKASGETLALTVLRDADRKQVSIPLEWATRIETLASPVRLSAPRHDGSTT